MKTLKNTQVDLLLDLLKDSEWHSNYELATHVGLRYGDAVYKARRKGHDIELKRVGNDRFYRWNRKNPK